MAKINRNDPCPCGSGKKYKQCCMNKATPAVQEKAPPLPPMTVSQMADMAYQYVRAERWAEAQPLVERLLKLSPRDAGLLYYRGAICRGLGQLREAVDWLERSVKQEPGNADYQLALGAALIETGRVDPAIVAFQQSIASRPTLTKAYVFLANALFRKDRFDEAVAVCRKALEIAPDSAECHSELGVQLIRLGQIEQALASFDRALELDPDCMAAVSNRLLASLYYHGYTAQQVFERHLAFAQRFEAPLKVHWRPHDNERSTQRRLRLAYVSADFRDHSVANFAEPVIAHHNKERFEVFIYSNNNYCDAVTARFQAMADGWRSCASWSDAQLAEEIRKDKIDILIDLAGHTGGNRLLTFARKPAPVQVTWIGYPGTTGLSAMDYRLTDTYLDPPGLTDAYYTERLTRLPSVFPFRHAANSPPVTPLPALNSPLFTLACLNNLAKINEAGIAVWSRILLALPQARLVLCNAGNPSTQRWLLELFAKHGIGPERLSLRAKMGMLEYLALHGEIDLALDSFPYTGGTTSMHSLWMGVPVVTLEGLQSAGRQGAANIGMAGLPQFIARNEQEYVDIVLHWAADLPALNALRLGLRERVAGIYFNADQFVHDVEQAFVDMWAHWCQSGV